MFILSMMITNDKIEHLKAEKFKLLWRKGMLEKVRNLDVEIYIEIRKEIKARKAAEINNK